MGFQDFSSEEIWNNAEKIASEVAKTYKYYLMNSGYGILPRSINPGTSFVCFWAMIITPL
jgi:hypothetical protein